MKTVVTKNDRQALAVKYIVIALSAVIIFFAPDLRYSQAAFVLNFDPTTPFGHTYTGTIVNYPYGRQANAAGVVEIYFLCFSSKKRLEYNPL